ncbi:hypothetical protein ACLB2K_015326 [Fragaria x ananassa]
MTWTTTAGRSRQLRRLDADNPWTTTARRSRRRRRLDADEATMPGQRRRGDLVDETVRLYDTTANVLRGEFSHGSPVLDCCFHDDSSDFSASTDNTVRQFVFNSNKEDIIGKHDAPVRCVEYSYVAGL